MKPHPHYYTRKDLCAVLMVSLSTIKRSEACGALKPTRVGPRIIRYSAVDVVAFLEERKKDDPPDTDES